MPQPTDLTIDFLRARRNLKWHRYDETVLPAWIAEMDLAIAPPIRQALERICAQQDCGYPERGGEAADRSIAHAFARRMARRFAWTIDPAHVQPCTELVQAAFAAIMAYSDQGDGVILQTPSYPPFYDSILETGRRLIANPLRDEGERYAIDFTALEALAAGGDCRVLLFCNPHNPTGRVFSRDELAKVGRIAIDHDLVIVSDEIHSDLVHEGRHVPIATLDEAIASRTVTLSSASKGFNIAGLRCGVMHFGSAGLRERFHKRLPAPLLGKPGTAGIDATIAAWDEGDEWLGHCLVHLRARRDQLAQRLLTELPEVGFHLPEATYLAWLDFTALGLPTTAYRFFLDKAAVALSDGAAFGAEYGQFARLNFATSEAILDALIDRMVTAVRGLDQPGQPRRSGMAAA